MPDAFGIALVLAPLNSTKALARITISLTHADADQLEDATLEKLRIAIPAARGLPLLQALALRHAKQVVLDYLGNTRLAVTIAPC